MKNQNKQQKDVADVVDKEVEWISPLEEKRLKKEKRKRRRLIQYGLIIAAIAASIATVIYYKWTLLHSPVIEKDHGPHIPLPEEREPREQEPIYKPPYQPKYLNSFPED